MSDLVKDFNTHAASIQKMMLSMRPGKLVETNDICNGVYLRSLFIPKGTTVVGATHLTEHIAVVASGECRVSDFTGNYHYKGFTVFKSPAGVKRVVYAIDDCFWITVHRTDEQDLDVIAEQLTDTPRAQLVGGADNLQSKTFEMKRKAQYAQIEQKRKPPDRIPFQQLCIDFDSS